MGIVVERKIPRKILSLFPVSLNNGFDGAFSNANGEV